MNAKITSKEKTYIAQSTGLPENGSMRRPCSALRILRNPRGYARTFILQQLNTVLKHIRRHK